MTISEIKKRVAPVARSYGVERVYLFGSYARGDATEKSDIDLRVDKGAIRGLFMFAGFQIALEEKLEHDVDVLATGALDDEFLKHIANEEVLIYEGENHEQRQQRARKNDWLLQRH